VAGPGEERVLAPLRAVLLGVTCPSGILVRQRGLPQAGSFEGVLVVVVANKFRHLAVPNVEDPSAQWVHPGEVQPTRLASPAHAEEHEDALVIQFPVLDGLLTEILPGTQPAPPSLSHARQPGPSAGRRPVGDDDAISGRAHSPEL
jgi:hypothetical protein